MWEPIAQVYDPLKAGSIDGTDSRPHDRAIERALDANYRTNKHVTSNPSCTLFVARLNPKTDESTLRQVFEKRGYNVKSCSLIRDVVTGHSKRYAFVELDKDRYAKRAQEELNGHRLEDYKLLVDLECERTLPGWVPRRLGGGIGGRKESGQLRFGGIDRPFRKPIVVERSADESGMIYAADQSDRHDRSADSGRVRDRSNNVPSRHHYDDGYKVKNREDRGDYDSREGRRSTQERSFRRTADDSRSHRRTYGDFSPDDRYRQEDRLESYDADYEKANRRRHHGSRERGINRSSETYGEYSGRTESEEYNISYPEGSSSSKRHKKHKKHHHHKKNKRRSSSSSGQD